MLKRIEGKLTHDMDLNLQCLLQVRQKSPTFRKRALLKSPTNMRARFS